MTRILTASFESTALDNYSTATSPAPSRDTSIFYRGVASLSCQATGTAKYNQFDMADGKIVVARFYMWWDTDASATSNFFTGLNAAGDLNLQLRPGLKLRAAVGATASADSAAMTLGVKYLIDVLLDSTGASSAVSYQIDRVAQTGTSRVQATTNMTFIRHGIVSAVTAGVHIDEVEADDSAAVYPIGPLLPKRSWLIAA